jgi:GGDEF domain-containing protein
LEEPLLFEELEELAQAVLNIWHRSEPSEVAGSQAVACREGTAKGSAAIGAAWPEATAVQCAVRHTAVPAEPELLDRLAIAVAACRQSRRPLSVLLAELAHFERLPPEGPQGLESLRGLLERVCCSLDHHCARVMPYGEGGFAVILPDCERQAAVEFGDQMIRAFRQLVSASTPAHKRPLAIAIGAATVSLPPKNFLAGDLLKGADRCLYGAKSSGGSVVRSIEIY